MIEAAKALALKVLGWGLVVMFIFWVIKYPDHAFSTMRGIWDWVWGIFDHGSESVDKLTGH